MAIKTCPRCKQQLRFPDHVGGMFMACPTCGQEFSSDFKLAAAKPHPPVTDEEPDREEEFPRRPGNFSVVV